MKTSGRGRAWILAGAGAMLLLAGCARYLYRSAGRPALGSDAKLAVVSMPVSDSVEAWQYKAVGWHVENALLVRGMNVVRISLQDVLSPEEIRWLIPNGFHSSRQALAKGLETGEQPQGMGEMFSRVFDSNEVIDAVNRLQDWYRLEATVVRASGLTHILLIRVLSDYEYEVYLIDRAARRVIWGMSVYANQRGWYANMTELQPSLHTEFVGLGSRSSKTRYRYHWVQLAERIARELTP